MAKLEMLLIFTRETVFAARHEACRSDAKPAAVEKDSAAELMLDAQLDVREVCPPRTSSSCSLGMLCGPSNVEGGFLACLLEPVSDRWEPCGVEKGVGPGVLPAFNRLFEPRSTDTNDGVLVPLDCGSAPVEGAGLGPYTGNCSCPSRLSWG